MWCGLRPTSSKTSYFAIPDGLNLKHRWSSSASAYRALRD